MISFSDNKAVDKYAYNRYKIQKLKRELASNELTPEMEEEARYQMKELRKKNMDLILND